MPRALVYGNGRVLATFDEHLEMRDLYYPYIGMEDHTTYGHVHHVGVFVEGKGFAWWSEPQWQREIRYTRETLVGNSQIRSDRLGIAIGVQDFVHPVHDMLLRTLTLQSTDGATKTVKVFFHHDFHIYGDKQKETAFYEPVTNSLIHYRQSRYFLIGGVTSHPVQCSTGAHAGVYSSILGSLKVAKQCGISSFTVGKSEYRGFEGTWRDAEDGNLQRNPIEQGSVDSTVEIASVVTPDEPAVATLWLCLGKTLHDVMHLQEIILEETPERLQNNCHNFWKSWVNKSHPDFGSLSEDVIDLTKRSLLTIRTQIDSRGAILAATDNDIMAFNRDTYTYAWPRDGAFVCLALDEAGHPGVTQRFFRFCGQIQTADGYLLHKYNPNGSLGSSWHPWFRGGEVQLPIQEDETALVLFALWHHFERAQDFDFLQELYENFARRAGNFLCAFREKETGLPLPSYDPWEEQRGVFTYTTACVCAGLQAAAKIAQALGHYTHSTRYHDAADEVKQALLFHLYDEGKRRFVKKIDRHEGRELGRDFTPDATVAALWLLGVLPPDDPRVVSTMDQVIEALTVRTSIGGIARYSNDGYQAVVPLSKDVPGNPWIITTLWRAQWHITRARVPHDLEPAREILDWTCRHASPTGILPEQLHPMTGQHLSVAPLTWSHATFVSTVLQFIKKESELSHT